LIITVGITCFNNGDNISETLSDLSLQRFSNGDEICEILVVASGCTDSTIHDVNEFVKRDQRFKLIIEPTRLGKPSAINKLIAQMKGDALLLVSGDVRIPQTDFVVQMANRIEGGVAVVGCRPIPVNGFHSALGQATRSIWSLHDKTLSVQNHEHFLGHAGEAFLIKKEAIDPIPGDIINDDAYLVLRAQQKGFKVAYDRDAIVLNRSPERVSELIRQRARIIRGHSQLEEVLGLSPDVLDVLAFKKPMVALRIVEDEIKDEVKDSKFKPRSFALLLVIEMAAQFVARFNKTRNNLWIPASSAKWHG
jgi:poly-beta-1,6-N-acetyl-D-glucosamine synthase